MAIKNLHDKPFDESTVAKLEIFEDYAQAWIPTFVMQRFPTICIFDFFAGTGYDKNGVPGSSIRILQKINEQTQNLLVKTVKIKVFLNELDRQKYQLLKKSCDAFVQMNKEISRVVEISYFNDDFEGLFSRLKPYMSGFPSLVYLDQNGIKFLSEKYFLELEKMSRTDFLYFVSASYFWRFGDKKEFKNHLDIDMQQAKKNPYQFIHRSIIKQLKQKLPENSDLKLYPFSLKKGANIYGIIFGASHPRAVDKFLSIAWKRNDRNGEANFDIDDDDGKAQQDLFERRLTKLEAFRSSVRCKILSQEITDNRGLFAYTMEEGHLGRHAAEVLIEMKKKGEITFDALSPLVTYEQVYKNGRVLKYVVQKGQYEDK